MGEKNSGEKTLGKKGYCTTSFKSAKVKNSEDTSTWASQNKSIHECIKHRFQSIDEEGEDDIVFTLEEDVREEKRGSNTLMSSSDVR